jgi:hypothetical protein
VSINGRCSQLHESAEFPTEVKEVGSSSFLVNTEWAFYPPSLGLARSGPAGGSPDTCDPSVPLPLPGASASSPPASPKVTMSQHPIHEPIPLRCFPCYSALNFMRRASWLGHSKG